MSWHAFVRESLYMSSQVCYFLLLFFMHRLILQILGFCMCDVHMCITQFLYGFEVCLVRTLEFSSSSDGSSFVCCHLLDLVVFKRFGKNWVWMVHQDFALKMNTMSFLCQFLELAQCSLRNKAINWSWTFYI